MMGRSRVTTGRRRILWTRYGMACRRFGLRKRGYARAVARLGDRLAARPVNSLVADVMAAIWLP